MIITAALVALFIGLSGFGSSDESPAPQYSAAPLTWEDAPEAMIELTATEDTRYGWVHYVDADREIKWTKDDVELYRSLNTCQDSDPVYVDVTTGTVYGDQDGNGRLDSDDCNWN